MIQHIENEFNGETGYTSRAKLNAVIDIINALGADYVAKAGTGVSGNITGTLEFDNALAALLKVIDGDNTSNLFSDGSSLGFNLHNAVTDRGARMEAGTDGNIRLTGISSVSGNIITELVINAYNDDIRVGSGNTSIRFKGSSYSFANSGTPYIGTLKFSNLTDTRNFYLPDGDGTIALESYVDQGINGVYTSLATVYGQLGTHSVQIGALQAADGAMQGDIYNLSIAKTTYLKSYNGIQYAIVKSLRKR